MLDFIKSLLSKKLGVAIGSIATILVADYQATGTVNWYTIVTSGVVACVHIITQGFAVDRAEVTQAIVDGLKIVEENQNEVSK